MGKSLGFTTLEVANQISAAFRGIIVQRFSDGSEEILIRIKYDSKQLKEIDLKNMFIMSSKNNFIPLSQIVELAYEKGFQFKRENGKTEISVTAEIMKNIAQLLY